jgi:hypothetical protein
MEYSLILKIFAVIVFQTEGYSASGDLPEWRNIHVTSIESIKPKVKKFNVRADFAPDLKHFYPEWEWHI